MRLSFKLLPLIFLTSIVSVFGLSANTYFTKNTLSENIPPEKTFNSDTDNNTALAAQNNSNKLLENTVFSSNILNKQPASRPSNPRLQDKVTQFDLVGIDGTGGARPTPNRGIDGTGGAQPTPNRGIDGTGGTRPTTDTGIDGSGGAQPIVDTELPDICSSQLCPPPPPDPCSSQPCPPPELVIAKTTVVLGTLEKLDGRFIVNGVPFMASSTTEIIGDLDESKLSSGHVVLATVDVDESGQGIAKKLTYTHSVSGVITDKTDQVTTVTDKAGQLHTDETDRSITVLGQKIVVSGDVVFGGMSKQFSDLEIGDKVNVSGFTLSNGDLSATRIELIDTDLKDKVTGSISDHNEMEKTFVINGLTVNYEQIDSVLLNNNVVVNIEGEVDDKDPTLFSASVISKPESILDNASETVELEGFITEFIDKTNFKIGDVAVFADLQTEYSGGSDDALGLNVKIEVEGSVDHTTNKLIAKKIIFKKAGLVARFVGHDDSNRISSSTETFTWKVVKNAKAYRLRIVQGGNDVFYDQTFDAHITSVIISGLPQTSAVFFVELLTLQGEFWSRNYYYFYGSGEVPTSELTSHKQGEQLTSDSATLTWSDVEGAEEYRIHIYDYFAKIDYYDNTFSTPEPVSLINLPTNSADLTVRLSMLHNGWWSIKDYDLKSVALVKNAILTSHTDRQPLTGSTETFVWEDVGAEQYELRVARRNFKGWFDILETITLDGSITSATISNLPTNSAKVYIRLRTKHDGWGTEQYIFPGVGLISNAELTSHSDRDVLSADNEVFTWTEVSEAEAYQLTMRNPVVDYDTRFIEDYDSFITSATINNLPKNGADIQLTLSTKHNGYWAHNIYKLKGSGELPDTVITSHVGYQKITTPSTTLTWADVGADAYRVRVLDLKTNPRVKVHDQTYDASTTSAVINDLPKNTRLYVEMSTKHGDWWAKTSTIVVTEIP